MTAIIDYREVIADLERRIVELQAVHDVLAHFVANEASTRMVPVQTARVVPPPLTAKPTRGAKAVPAKAAPINPSAKQSRYASEAPRIRKLALENYHLNLNQLKERFNLPMSTETMRQILNGTLYPDPEWDVAEYKALRLDNRC